MNKEMKNILMLFILALLLVSCVDDLERDIVTELSEKQVIQSYEFTRARVSAIYNELPNGFSQFDGAMSDAASDNAEFTLETSAIQKFNVGSWNAYDNPDDVWNKYFRGIRKANQFLLSADSVNLDPYRLDPDPAQQIVYQTRLAEINRWKYEVRFLRSFYYFELVKRYGGVPIITEPFSLDEVADDVKRNTLEQCIQFIVNECNMAADVLPLSYGSADLGRVTKTAALGLKSRVLLYAASELFNNPSWAGGYPDAELISMSAGDRSARWKAAADAAKDVIDLAGSGLSLHGNYGDLFKTFNSPEILFVRRNGASNSFEMTNYPVGFDKGQSGNTPSQDLIDSYEVKVDEVTSVPFDWNNPEHAANPYENRDPRLSMTVVVNNDTFKNRKIETWDEGLDGRNKYRASRTGYYLRKYVDDKLDLLVGTTSIHSWIIMRLPEIYLNYAEALNEYEPGNPDIKVYIDKVRTRSGVNMPAINAGLSQEAVRSIIRNERRIEFAFEDHRLWDVRRWMIASTTLGAPLRGIDIIRQGDDGFKFNQMTVEQRSFENKMYFYPIPQQELLKAKGLVQNPLW